MSLIESEDELIEFTLSDGLSEEETKKAEWILKHYVEMIGVMKNYQYAMEQTIDGFSLYDIANAHGGGKRERGTEPYSDVTANTVVLKDKREAIYQFYLFATNVIRNAISCLYDPHQKAIAELLFIKGMSFVKATDYMGRGYSKELYPIAPTTFADQRRRCVQELASMLSLNGLLDFVVVRRSGRAGRKKDEYGFVLLNWTEPQ